MPVHKSYAEKLEYTKMQCLINTYKKAIKNEILSDNDFKTQLQSSVNNLNNFKVFTSFYFFEMSATLLKNSFVTLNIIDKDDNDDARRDYESSLDILTSVDKNIDIVNTNNIFKFSSLDGNYVDIHGYIRYTAANMINIKSNLLQLHFRDATNIDDSSNDVHICDLYDLSFSLNKSERVVNIPLKTLKVISNDILFGIHKPYLHKDKQYKLVLINQDDTTIQKMNVIPIQLTFRSFVLENNLQQT